MDILTIVFSGIAALCAFLSFVSLDFQRLKTEWRLRKAIRKLGGAKKIRKMTGDEFIENYHKEIGQEPIVKDIKRIEEITGANFTFPSLSETLFRNIFSPPFV